MSPITTKQRTTVDPGLAGYSVLRNNGVEISRSPWLSIGGERQTTVSQGNPVSRIGGRGDIGGSFITQRVTGTPGRTRVSCDDLKMVGTSRAYFGPMAAYDRLLPQASGGYIAPSSTAQMNVYGAQAISRCLPTNPLSGLGQFLGELSDVPKVPDIKNWKAIIQNFRQETRGFNFDRASRKAADEYLNQVFGWMPFVSDILDVAKTVKNSSQHIQKYMRGSNHLIHRQYRFPSDSTTTTATISSSWYGDPPIVTYLVVSAGRCYRTIKTSTDRWFSGAFTYYLPQTLPNDNGFVRAINDWKRREQIANRLLGTRLTPDLLYKLTPWTWALDYVTNAGSVVRNWSAFANDGLVMHHGYIMEHILRDTVYSLSQLRLINGSVISSDDVIRSETKMRQRGTPYGFGANPATFTSKQWGVIAALGISKQPLSLNF